MTFSPHGCWIVTLFEWTLAGVSGCGNRLYCSRICSSGRAMAACARAAVPAMRCRIALNMVGAAPQQSGSGLSIGTVPTPWHDPLSRFSCHVVWVRGMDMRKQVAVEPADYPRGYVVLSLSPRHIPPHAAQRHAPSLARPLRIRLAGVVQSALRPFPAPVLCRCLAPHVNACP